MSCYGGMSGPPEEIEVVWEEDEEGVWHDSRVDEGAYVNEESEKEKVENEVLARRLEIMGL
jgi:hypothetical protein